MILFLSYAELRAQEAAPAAAVEVATVHGVVRNAATGEPLPRALVRIEGNADTGALTDGDGRFEIPGVPVGPQAIQVRKPGYLDRPHADPAAATEDPVGPAHNVMVAAEMPDLVFTLAPPGSIRGQIELSTGDPAQGIKVTLLKRTVLDGRAVWTTASTARTNRDGIYRFGGLTDGVYAIYTAQALDSESFGGFPQFGGLAERAGYASVFYPDARDLAGAAKIRLASGEEAQANFALTLEPFHKVTITALLPREQPAASGDGAGGYSAVIMDTAGHELVYGALYNSKTHTAEVLLPDGSYSLLVSTNPRAIKIQNRIVRSGAGAEPDNRPLAGIVDFSVAGHAVSNLRVPLAVQHPNPVLLTVLRTAAPAAQSISGQGGPITVIVSQTDGWIDQGMVSAYANGTEPGAMEAAFTPPGAYWVHTNIGQRGLCEASFTAGGANLAREPVAIGLSGTAAPMELTLRDECARLTVSLPPAGAALGPGEEPYYTIYAIPDFDFTRDVVPLTLRPSSGGTMTLEDLTPGSYHVYTLEGSAPRLEYRNPEALAALQNPGQAITLAPGVTGNLILEVPGR